jgi:hypothetical protein
VFQVVAAQCAVGRRQRCAALIAELFGMQLDGQAQGSCGVKHALGLRRAEGDGLAEGVHGVDQAGGVLTAAASCTRRLM